MNAGEPGISMSLRRSVFATSMKHRLVSIAFVWLFVVCQPAWAQFGGLGEKAGAVTTSIVADTKAVAAGKPFTVGVRFEIKPEWYIYWRFVGDIGLATNVEWTLPEGFKAGALQWPLPHSHEAAGDFLNYVYERETLLFAEITPPAPMPADPIAIKAKLTWQMCNAEQCVPGNASAVLYSRWAQRSRRTQSFSRNGGRRFRRRAGLRFK